MNEAVEIKNKRLTTQTHVRQLLTETINNLRRVETRAPKDEIEKARVLGYLASLMQMNLRDCELEKRIEKAEKFMKYLSDKGVEVFGDE
ncbi:hypothetical protein JTI58_10835 [Lysinibacillus fusiformis]|uniref:hypothetical protein n=1 Tax=Lysinibacillus fusiformis TaxID=28031 RepID=UPI0019672D0E|nr:hypothetical protein [Lysinibacillus fusiformis]QSB12060.1 hypothetical protein JTI58_10835 [Lysinibacillus fusiformis]